MPLSSSKIRKSLSKIFESSGQQPGHQNIIDATKKLYNEVGTVNDAFTEEFIKILKYVMMYSDKTGAERMLSFVSKFVVSLYITEQQSNSNCSDDLDADVENKFVNSLLDFLLKVHWSVNINVRLRSVTLINNILTSMPENSFISCEMWKKLVETIKNRIQDKNPGVRVAAVLAARKLQEPKNPKCQIMTVLLFHLLDPAPAVRRAVISSIAICKATIDQVLERTLDVNDNVRRNTYAALAKVRFTSFAISHRLKLLERGLKDRSEKVRKCVENVMLPQWFEGLNQNTHKLLEGIDVVNCPKVGASVVKALLNYYPANEVISCIPIDEETHLVPVDKLTPEMALLLCTVCTYFNDNKREEELETLMPTLSAFCDYIKNFCPLNAANSQNSLSEDQLWENVKNKSILYHLFELTKLFDYTDEVGRSSLQKLISSVLTDCKMSLESVQHLVEILRNTVPDENEFLNLMAKLISEIREPLVQVTVDMPQLEQMELKLKISGLRVNLNELREQEYEAVSRKDYAEAARLKEKMEEVTKEIDLLSSQPVTTFHERQEEKCDAETLSKCLSIMYSMVQASGVRTFTPVLRSLHENLICPSAQSDDLLTQSLVLKTLAQCCVLDRALASDNLLKFIFTLSQEGDVDVHLPALKAIFDILQTYGMDIFKKFENASELEDLDLDSSEHYQNLQSTTNLRERCIYVLKGLLKSSEDGEIKAVAFEGFCKLLVNGIIYSPSVLKRIIVEGFTPIIGNEYEDKIRQLFMVFFPVFASKTARSQEMIEESFIPVMRLLNNSPTGSPEADINPRDVVVFLIDHTKPGINASTPASIHVHNNLAIAICMEILKDISLSVGIDFDQFYLKALLQLHLSLESESYVDQLRNLVIKIKREIHDNALQRLINQFQIKIDGLLKLNAGSVGRSIQNTLQSIDESNNTRSTESHRITGSVASAQLSVLPELQERAEQSSYDEDDVIINGSQHSIVNESPEIL